MDPQCKLGIFVGFDKDMSSYRIWDMENRKLVWSRDVLFSRKEEEMGKIFTKEAIPCEDEVKQEAIDGTTINEGDDNSNKKIIDSFSAVIDKEKLKRKETG